MKYKNNIFLFLFVVFLIASLSVNIIIVRATTQNPDEDFFHINGIYFDLTLIQEQEKAEKILFFINTNNPSSFKRIISQKEKSIAQFYAFCGLMKSDEKKAQKYLPDFLNSNTIINIIIDSDNIKNNYPIGYAVLLLLKNSPEKLSAKPTDNFFMDKNIENALVKAYKSNMAEKIQEYKSLLLETISEKNPELAKEILNNIDENILVTNMTLQQKLELSIALKTLPSEKKYNLIKVLLNENDDRIILNSLNSIAENDSQDIAQLITKIFYGNYSGDIGKLAIEKYALVLKKDSLIEIKNYMRTARGTEIIIAGLTQINKYGEESNYDFLKNYLDESYSEKINVAALEAIVSTTYKNSPGSVFNTMSYVLRWGLREELAYFAVNFYIKNNIKDNYGTVLYRLKQKESERMKKIALEYIEKFNLKEGAELLFELKNDPDTQISTKAKALINTLGISEKDINILNE